MNISNILRVLCVWHLYFQWRDDAPRLLALAHAVCEQLGVDQALITEKHALEMYVTP